MDNGFPSSVFVFPKRKININMDSNCTSVSVRVSLVLLGRLSSDTLILQL